MKTRWDGIRTERFPSGRARRQGQSTDTCSTHNSISHKVFLKSFCISQFPHKFVNSFCTSVIVKDKLTDLWGSWFLLRAEDEGARRAEMAQEDAHPLLSHKVLFKSFCKSQFPHESVNLVVVKDKLTALWGS